MALVSRTNQGVNEDFKKVVTSKLRPQGRLGGASTLRVGKKDSPSMGNCTQEEWRPEKVYATWLEEQLWWAGSEAGALTE